MLNIVGRFRDSNGNKFTGLQIQASFTEKVSIEETGKVAYFFKPSECRGEVHEDGSFTLTLPDRSQIEEPIILKLLTPDGEVIGEKDVWSVGANPCVRLNHSKS